MATELRGTASGVARSSRRAGTGAMLTARFMAKMAVSTALCGLALVAAGGAAQAQAVNESARKPYALRIGSYIPSEQGARRAGGTHNLVIEADYTVQRIPERSSVGVISLGFIEREKLRIVPFTLTQIYREPGGNFLGHPYYYGLGVGIYTVRMQYVNTDDRIKHLFGGLVTAGVDMSDTFFIDAKYHYISKYDNYFIGGLQLAAGVRF